MVAELTDAASATAASSHKAFKSLSGRHHDTPCFAGRMCGEDDVDACGVGILSHRGLKSSISSIF